MFTVPIDPACTTPPQADPDTVFSTLATRHHPMTTLRLGGPPRHPAFGLPSSRVFYCAVDFETPQDAATNPLMLAFGRLQGAANRLAHILGRALEQECGITHLEFEVLLILGRAGEPGMSMRAISQEQVLTTGGATRVIDRLERAGLVVRGAHPTDKRGRLVKLTEAGAERLVRASTVHFGNIERYFLAPLPEGHRERFADDLRILSHAARDALPPLR
jgi:DNA-binding MarR family transcriptional regulator